MTNEDWLINVENETRGVKMPVRGKSLRDVALAACFSILISPKILFAWTTPVNISNTTGHSRFASLAVDRYGHIHVVWEDDTSGNNEVLYCFYNGDYWSAPLNISNDATDSERSDITVDVFGQLHVAWKDHQSGEIYWTFYAGTSWASPVNISNNPGYSTCPSLAADDSGRVYIVWHDIGGEQSDIYFSSYDGISWSTPQNVTNDPLDSAYPNIVVDSKGYVHLVWMNYGLDIEAYYSKYDGISWSSWVNISNLEGYSCDPKIALDSEDRPHVVWEEREHGYEVYYTHFDGEDWTVPHKLSQTNSYRPALALDSEDRGHVVWGGSKRIYYTSGSDTSWSVPFDIADSSETNCLLPDIAIDSIHLHVVWTKAIDRTRAEIYYSSHKWSGVKPQSWRPFPQGYRLEQCYPNPFNATTVIRYSLLVDRPCPTTLKVYNIRGEEVITLVDQEQKAGRYKVVWDGRTNQGKEVTSGVYFYSLKVQGDGLKVTKTRKIVLLR